MKLDDCLRFGPLGGSWVHLLIDMLRMFAEPTEWHTPWMESVLPNAVAMTELDPARTIFTRFIPPKSSRDVGGSWRRYYRDVLEQMIRDLADAFCVGGDGPFDIGRVPVHDRADDEVRPEARNTLLSNDQSRISPRSWKKSARFSLCVAQSQSLAEKTIDKGIEDTRLRHDGFPLGKLGMVTSSMNREGDQR